ncbi:hypothetical protein HGM15179_016419 [Zosterops borbonicus]|uniref:Uncharacterized protein n=1 Tax=Zosterops borbonicus TaxID=364589 RepID=A0A8K1G2V0_9PASS|nr:hypothetical protein HGM15179_016419 [Zosterops borbonicus]
MASKQFQSAQVESPVLPPDLHGITKYPVVEGTHQDHRVQLLAQDTQASHHMGMLSKGSWNSGGSVQSLFQFSLPKALLAGLEVRLSLRRILWYCIATERKRIQGKLALPTTARHSFSPQITAPAPPEGLQESLGSLLEAPGALQSLSLEPAWHKEKFVMRAWRREDFGETLEHHRVPKGAPGELETDWGQGMDRQDGGNDLKLIVGRFTIDIRKK